MTKLKLQSVIATVEARSTNFASTLHGPQHWRCVALLGIRLARQTREGDPLVAFLFGLFHDSMRENEDDDPGHGVRGAELLQTLASDGLVCITLTQLYDVLRACETHTTAPPTTVPSLGICYDADRLTLWRVCIVPEAAYLSTIAGQELARTKATRTMHETPLSWDDVLGELFS